MTYKERLGQLSLSLWEIKRINYFIETNYVLTRPDRIDTRRMLTVTGEFRTRGSEFWDADCLIRDHALGTFLHPQEMDSLIMRGSQDTGRGRNRELTWTVSCD